MATSDRPDTIHGGCLCGSIRYEITFPSDHDFLASCTTCQCSQCRRQTGSLIFRVQQIPLSAITFTAQSTLNDYYATPGHARGFCTACGSLLYWRSDGQGRTSITVGTIDPEYLRRHGGLLTTAAKHFWCEEEVPGVTDHLKGERWAGDNEGDDARRMPE